MAPDAAIRPCVFSDEISPDFEEAVRLAAEAGAEGLELRGKMWGRAIAAIDADDAERVRAVCARHGMSVAILGSPVGKCSPDDPEECRTHAEWFGRMCELADFFGTPLVRGFALWRPNHSRDTDHLRPDLEHHLPRITAFLEPLVRQAERAGVRLCLETEGATMVGTCREACRVMEALGRPAALGVAWDVNNGLSCGESPYPEGYELIRDRVYHLHVKPNAAGSLATVAETPLTYEALLRTLRADGFRGWASIEHWGSPEAMLRGVRELAPVLARVNA